MKGNVILNSVSSGSNPVPEGGSSSNNMNGSNTNFESYYHNICASLQTKGEVHSVSKVFAQLSSDEERVKFVLEHRLLTGAMTFQWWKDYNFVQKDRTESQRLRNLGKILQKKIGKITILSKKKSNRVSKTQEST